MVSSLPLLINHAINYLLSPCCREVIQKQTATVQRGISVKRVLNDRNQPMMTTMGDVLRGLIVLREPLPLLLVLLANSGSFIFY